MRRFSPAIAESRWAARLAEHRQSVAWYTAVSTLVAILFGSAQVAAGQEDPATQRFTAPLGVTWAMGSAPPTPATEDRTSNSSHGSGVPPGGTGRTSLRGTALAKAIGGFTYRWFADGTIAPDPTWISANIRTEEVPILGSMTCHRLVFPQVRAAMSEIRAAGLADAVHPAEYGGCYVPRFIDRDPSRPISLHTFGIAFDINVPDNQMGTPGTMDPRLVQILARWGFAWGGVWDVPDPMHFELASLFATP